MCGETEQPVPRQTERLEALALLISLSLFLWNVPRAKQRRPLLAGPTYC